MKKSLIALAVLGATSGLAMAASNVTLYGLIETGVLAQKATEAAADDLTFQMKSGFDSGSRWGIKGVEDLGNGYAVGFQLEQGFDSDTGTNSSNSTGKTFGREAALYVQGGFGKLAVGRFGSLASGAGSYHILSGWAIGTGYGLSAWTTKIGTSFSRIDNAVAYATPSYDGLSFHAMYSNKTAGDDSAKWSENNHYYGVGVKYQAGAVKSSLIFETADNKAETGLAAENKYVVNYGLEYNLGDWTPMFAYQYATQDGGLNTHMVGLSAKVPAAGGDLLVGARYLTGEKDKDQATEEDVRSWNIGAAYVYPLSKRTQIKTYAGYADSSKGWKNEGDVVYNGYQVFVGMKHSF